ncbi:phosphatase PAP2 family protein [Sinomonas halotolerans]|uniref:Phosphatase PAP2 family protein n=1 Tax=Sinomonas halotolerans TaxID=1644133 RepID=A0ABU9X0N5_9MICC
MRRLLDALARWLGPNASMWALLAIGAGLTLALSVAGGEVYESVAQKGRLASMDQPVLEAAVAARTPESVAAVTAFTNLGGGLISPIAAAAAAILIAIRTNHWRALVLVPAAGAGSLLVTVFGKDLAGRARPPLASAVPPFEYSPSFPSGHTLNATVLAGIIVYLVALHLRRAWPRAAAIAVAALYAFAMGLSRVYLGHHWLTDVIAAWLLGLAWLSVVVFAHRVFILVRARRARRAGRAGRAGPGG